MDTPPLDVNGETIAPKKTMNVLGVLFEESLVWDCHDNKILDKARI